MNIACEIETNQLSEHEDVLKLAEKASTTVYQRPYAQHTLDAFEKLQEESLQYYGHLVLDACCGVGESSLYLAEMYPDVLIVGVDKSLTRLRKHAHYQDKSKKKPHNLLLLRADMFDLWRLLSTAVGKNELNVKKQFIFYPNPYPKKSQVGKRWHASPVMPHILKVSRNLECRSNWLIYLQEFQKVLTFYGLASQISEVEGAFVSPFERKYRQSEQRCWQLMTEA